LRPILLSLLFAIAVAVNLRANHVQITYYVAFLAAVWWLAEAVAAVRLGRVGRFAGSTLALGAGAVAGVLMSAQPYLATWVYKAQSIRAAGEGGGMAWERAMAWSQGYGELLTLLVAGAYGGGGQTYWGPKPFTAGPHYLGVVVLLLAVFGVLGVRRRAATGIAIGAVLMTLFALGENLPVLNRFMFDAFPLFDSFRAPETWLIAVALAAAVLAAYGVYWVCRREVSADAETRKTRYIYLGLAGGAAVLVLVWLVGPSLASFSREGERDEIVQALSQQAGVSADDPRLAGAADEVQSQLRTERSGAMRGDALRSLIFLGLAAGLLVAYRREKLPSWVVQGGLAALVLIDLGGVSRRYFNEESPALRRTSDQAAAIPRYSFDTFIQERVAEEGGPGAFRVLPFVPALGLTPTADGRSAFYYESVGGNHGAKLALFERFSDQVLFSGPTGVNDRALDLLSVRYVVAQGALPDMQAVYQDPETGVLVLENPDVLPRAWLVDSVRVVDEEASLAALLNAPTFEPARTALISPPVGVGIDLDFYNGPAVATAAPADTGGAAAPADTGAAAVAASDTTTLVRRQRFTPREIVYEVRTDRPRVLVFSEVFYPHGWTATVDDAPAPILRADMLLRAVPVPSGRHLVRLRYDPPSHRTGVRVSVISALIVYLAAVALAGLLWYRQGHRPK
jgi:hypothetical protein